MINEEVALDPRIHARLIGAKGRAIRKIMDQYKVDIRFPRQDSEHPDIVLVTGEEDDVLDCKDYLLNQAEEFVSNHVSCSLFTNSSRLAHT
jgi:hypothetical protein